MFFNILVTSLILICLRTIFVNSSVSDLSFIKKVTKLFLSLVLFYLLSSLTLINYSLDFYYLHSSFKSTFLNQDIILTSGELKTFDFLNGALYNTEVYVYPFIYVFVLVTSLSIVFCLTYNYDELASFMFYCVIILLAGYALFFTDSFIIFFFAYEMLLVPSFFILYKFAKTRRAVEAAYLMFFWTQFGALFLIVCFIYLFFISGSSTFFNVSNSYLSETEVNFIFVCLICGFGVKLPIWPFYGWLPKAHVEASTNFSIFLSGVLVKFAFFGLMKCLVIISLEPTFIYVYPFLFIGIVDAVFKLFYQIDLKKLVAYSTVVEMHWLTICVVSGQSNLMLASFCMLISHALLSTNSFLIVDAIARRFKTRLITEFGGLNFLCPKLFLVSLINLLIFLGFPGSIFFVSEFLFFSFFLDLFPFLALTLLLFLYLLGPTFFFRSWVNLLFGFSTQLFNKIPVDLSSRELILFLGIPFLMYWMGISWQAFVV